MSKLTVSIIAHNEADELDGCLQSVCWADEIIVVDCSSSDQTYDIACKYTDKVYRRENLANLNINKSFSISKATMDWILYIDPDERVSEPLREEMWAAINSNATYAGYCIPRKNYYFGRWLKRGSKYPDFQLRLFRRGKGRFPCEHIHERLEVDGDVGYLQCDLEHFPCRTVSELVEKFNFYTSWEADYLSKNDIPINGITAARHLFFRPFSRMVRRYFLKGGFLDGLGGFLACEFDALGSIVSFAKYWERQTKNGK
ncbi:MAG: glycosyltransferase family 2 protein [bacterium]